MQRLVDLVGSTPLIELPSLSALTGATILAKCEFLNPGGSIKDRAALAMIRGAEKRGQLKPGMTLVEGTAGNTGIGLATLAPSLGYRVHLVLPDNQAEEKYSVLRALGAQITLVSPAPFMQAGQPNPAHFYHRARALVDSLNDCDPGSAWWVNQFENIDNQAGHFEHLGQEIWSQTQGQVTHFVCAAGTGGTMAGVSRKLKQHSSKVRTVLVDPSGSGLYSYFKTGLFKSEGSSVTEGIGIMRLTENMRQAAVDECIQVSDQKMYEMLLHLAENEGLFVGLSAAMNVFGACSVALKAAQSPMQDASLSRPVIVTVLCDHGSRYQSKTLSSAWLKEKGLVRRPLTLV